MPIDLSPEVRPDPTRAGQIIDRYEPRAVALVRAYLRAVKDAIRQRDFAHASPATMTLGQFLRYMQVLAKREITDKSVFSEEMSARAYGQGRAFGGIVLGAPPEVRERIWKKTSVLVERSKSSFVKMSDDVAGNVKRVIADGITKEWSQGEIIKEIEALSEASESSARRIVRTETMEAVNTGVMDTYRAEEIEKVEWLAAEGCCDACQAHDGRVYAIDSGVSAPLHPNCMCTLLPVVDVPGKDIVEAEEWVE